MLPEKGEEALEVLEKDRKEACRRLFESHLSA
jgi:hypothetical protein